MAALYIVLQTTCGITNCEWQDKTGGTSRSVLLKQTLMQGYASVK